MKLSLALIVLFPLACAVPATVQAQLFAQQDRYELGQRLRRFELAWQTADVAARGRSVSAMEAAVNQFFRLQLKQAGRHLDQAYLTVLGAESSPAHGWALSQRVAIDPLVADAQEPQIRVGLRDFYDVEGFEAEAGQIELQVVNADQRTVSRVQRDVTAAREGFDWETGCLDPGDYRLVATLHYEGQSYLFSQTMFSRMENWDQRLQAIKDRLPAIAETSSPTGLATLKQLLSLLESLRDNRVQEADTPVNRRLEFCEALLQAGGRSDECLSVQRAGDFSLTLSNGRQQLPVRIRVPDRVGKSLPVLVAYHGAGGSENMFFETYGAGRLVKLGAERGWLVVAPRQGLLGLSMDCPQMLDVLAEHFPVDRQRVFLVGHSMGAAQVVSQVSRHAAVISAAVALGGGRGVVNAVELRSVPWFVAAGERDFGRRGAQSLWHSLEAVEADVRWLEVPQVEHMVVVQAAMDDVFRFLDEVSQSRN